jgi:hypothetical protein
MKYAFVASDIVTEVISPVDGIPLDEQYHPDFLKSLVQCDDTVQQGWLYSGKNFSAAPVPEITAADLTAYVGAKRFLLETGGYTFSSHPISTDRDSQSKIGNIAVAATVVGPSFSTDWKCSDGTFITLNHDDALAMATAIMNFVSACFATEATITAAISAGTVKAYAEIDASSWPANH